MFHFMIISQSVLSVSDRICFERRSIMEKMKSYGRVGALLRAEYVKDG